MHAYSKSNSDAWILKPEMMLRALSILLLLVSLNLEAETPIVTIAADRWCPINCEPDSDKPGILIEIARDALAKHGHQLKYINQPWARAIIQAREGKIDGIVGAFVGDAPDFVFPEEAMIEISGSALFVQSKDPWEYTGIDSLKYRQLGAILDYDYGEELNNYIMGHADSGAVELIGGNQPLERNIKRLMLGRLNVIVEAEPVFWYTAQQMGLSHRLRKAGRVSPPEPCYVAFSPAHPKARIYAQWITEHLVDMRATGKLASLYASYGLAEEKIAQHTTLAE